MRRLAVVIETKVTSNAISLPCEAKAQTVASVYCRSCFVKLEDYRISGSLFIILKGSEKYGRARKKHRNAEYFSKKDEYE